MSQPFDRKAHNSRVAREARQAQEKVRRDAIAEEYGQPFEEVVAGFARDGESKSHTAEILGYSPRAFMQLLHREGLDKHFTDGRRRTGARVAELERELRRFYAADGTATECDSIEEARERRIAAAQRIQELEARCERLKSITLLDLDGDWPEVMAALSEEPAASLAKIQAQAIEEAVEETQCSRGDDEHFCYVEDLLAHAAGLRGDSANTGGSAQSDADIINATGV